MYTLLTKMFREPRKTRTTKRVMNLVALEDRAVPASFSFGGVNFDTDNMPDQFSFLSPGTYSGAIVTSDPSTATIAGVNFPDQYTSFPATDSLGSYFFGDLGSGAIRPLNLPAGNDGTTARSGFEADYLNGRAIPGNGQMIVYESASSNAKPQAFMIQAYDVSTGTWSPWFYSPESINQFATYINDSSGAGAFYVTYNLSDLVPSGDYISKFRLANMTSLDRMVNADGLGDVIPNDPVTTDPVPANPIGYSSYNDTYFDPDPVYFGSLGSATSNIANVQTTVTSTPATSATAGSPLDYTVTITNLGPADATGVDPDFTLDPNYITSGITSSSTGGATGNTTDPNTDDLTLPSGSSVTYVIDGSVNAATSTTPLVSTFFGGTPAAPVTDPNPADNTAVSTLPVALSSDVSVSITPPSGNAPAGAPITYTVTVANSGPADVNGVGIKDVIPAGLVGVTYDASSPDGATGFTPSGSGAIDDTADMPAGSSIIYTVTGTIPPTYSGPNPFTVNTTLPADFTNTDPNGGSKTINTTAVLQGDLYVTIQPVTASPIAGTTVTFTIVAGNTGPSTATSTLVADVLNAEFTSVNYTSVVTAGTASGNTASGSGNINDALTLAAGSKVTYTVLAKLSPNASGNVTNTASITAPSGFTDTNQTNNTATSSLTVIPGSDVTVSVTPSPTTATVGGALSYHVVVTNNGPATANGVKVTSVLDKNLLNPTYTSTATPGVTGNTASGSGNLGDTLNLPSGTSASYEITGTVNTGITGNLVSTFTSNNPNPDPNTPIDTVTVTTPIQNSTNVIYAASTGENVVTQVFVFNADGSERFSYQPYDSSFTRGVNVSVGDINGDGFPDVVTGASSGGGSHVHAVNGFTGQNLFSFFAYGPTVNTGVNVAVGDVTGPGQEDIVTGSDTGGGPRVRVFDITKGGANGSSILDFFAFPSSDRYGVRVALGDVNGDGLDEIIASEGPGGSPYVKIFNGQTGAFISQFMPFGDSTRGVYVAAGDLNGDGKADIIVGDGSSSSTVRTFNSANNFALLNQFSAYESTFTGGVRVATYTDNIADPVDPPTRILTGPGIGGGPRLRKFTVTGGDLGSQFLIDSFNRGGIYVG